MPPVNQPRLLSSLAADVACEYTYMVVSKATELMKDVNFEYSVGGGFQQIVKNDESIEETPHHFNKLKMLMMNKGFIPRLLQDNLADLPTCYLEDFIHKLFVCIARNIIYDEDDINSLMNVQWAIGVRVRVNLQVVLKTLMSTRISTLNISIITDPFFKVLASFFMKPEFKNIPLINELVEIMRTKMITATVFSNRDYVANITTLSLQHMASEKIVSAIIFCCPNLWHLDISGNLFDMERYCVVERAKMSSDSTKDGKYLNQFCADFIEALAGIYGGQTYRASNSFEEVYSSLRKLRTLRLPDMEWNSAESMMLIEHGIGIFQYCLDLQEFTGVNLYKIFMHFRKERNMPMIMKLRVFNADPSVNFIPKDIFRTVRVPCITEVDVMLHPCLGLWILNEFPNMKHLRVRPRYPDIYNCSTILPYLANLSSLDIKFGQEITLNNMCEIADGCKSLQSFKLACPGLLTDGASVNGNKKSGSASVPKKDNSKPTKKSGRQKSQPVLWSFSDYIQTWLNTYPAPYEQDERQIPKFSKLLTLRISEVKNTDIVALYKCIKGSPNMRTFSFIALEGGDDRIKSIDDDFVGRISPLFKSLKELTLGAEDKKGCNVSLLKNLTGAAVEHIVNICMNIESIGNVQCWNVSSREVKSMNKRFKMLNYILRLH